MDFLALDPKQLLKLEFSKCVYPDTKLIVQVSSSEVKQGVVLQEPTKGLKASGSGAKLVDMKKYEELKLKLIKSEASKQELVKNANEKINILIEKNTSL